MKVHLFKLALVLGSLLPATPSRAQPKTAPAPAADIQATYSVATDREPVASLDGLWHFQPGDNPRWADSQLDDSSWALVRSDQDWSDNGYGRLSGTAWYRFRVTVPAGEESYSLRLPTIYTCYQVFVDGQLFLTQGRLPPHPALFRTHPAVVDLPSDGRSTPQTFLIALRVWHDPHWNGYRHGGLQGSAEIGRSDLIHARFDTESQAHLWQYSDEIDLAVLDLLALVISLALFLTRRSEREFLWFSVVVLGQAGNHVVEAWASLHVNNVETTDFIQTVCQSAFTAGLLLFFRALFRGRWTLPLKFALLCCALGFLTSPIAGAGLLPVATNNFLNLLLSLPVYLWIILFVRRQAKLRMPDARMLLGPVIALFSSWSYTQLIWSLETAGLTFFRNLQIKFRHPFYLTINDLAEGFFLLAMLGILLSRFARTRREQDRIESEFEAARSVQQVLVPESLPQVPGLAISASYQPAQEVGGDFFQILPLASGDTLLIIGDVAGKGLPAALTVSLVVGTLRALCNYTQSPGEILAGLNSLLQGRSTGFTTCLALRISADRSVLTFANAGHLAPYINGFELRTDANLPLGIVPEAEFTEIRYELKKGDHITVLTDGVPEAMHNRELFGFERTHMLSRNSAAHIAEAARSFGQADDITVLTVDVVSVFASSTEQINPLLQPA